MPDLEKFVAEWKGHMNGDRGIEDMVAEDAQILSPAYWAPKQGKEYVMQVLGSVIRVLMNSPSSGNGRRMTRSSMSSRRSWAMSA